MEQSTQRLVSYISRLQDPQIESVSGFIVVKCENR